MAPYKCSDIEARVIQVLEENLASEMVFVDSVRGGDPTDLSLLNYLAGPRPVVHNFPAVQVDVKAWRPKEDRSLAEDTTGRGQYWADTEVSVHVQSTGQSTNEMRDTAQRYMAGIERVLLYRKPGLETAANPVRFCESIERDGAVTVVDEAQSSGALMRSVRLPISIWMIEALDS